MAGVIDADTHIIEHPGVWEHIAREFYPRRPVTRRREDIPASARDKILSKNA